MKVTDYILDFLSSQGVRHVFGITGGFITPLFDAFHGRDDIRYICTQHEQAAAMAADGYARINGLGVAVSTSGPGATNLITGIGCSYFDSIPILCITGQVPRGEARGKSGVRQRGFQETDIVSIVKPLTKYARQVNDPKDVPYALEAALWNAKEGRPGPVLLDFPMDVLMADVSDEAVHFPPIQPFRVNIETEVDKVVKLIAAAKRPVIIYGQGARHARAELLQFIEATGIPCLPSWAALDLIPHDHPLFVTQFGVYGNRAGNFAVQNADLVIAIGTRLDGRMTGKRFAPKARLVVVDIDIHEAAKHKPDVMVIGDTLDFLRAINTVWETNPPKTSFSDFCFWTHKINAWKDKYQLSDADTDPIQPRAFVRKLNDLVSDDSIIITDCGANLAWVQQAFIVRGTQRLWSAYGNSPMGYSLPAAIGAHYASGKPVICLIGDGGIQINIQELQTLAHYNIPVKVFIFNNGGYGIIRQFQDELYEGRYEASTENNPAFHRIAEAYGIPSLSILGNRQIDILTARALDFTGPVVCDVLIDPGARIFPKVCFGNTLENQHPLLPPEEVAENMKDD